MERHHKRLNIINRTGGAKTSLVHFEKEQSVSTSPFWALLKPACPLGVTTLLCSNLVGWALSLHSILLESWHLGLHLSDNWVYLSVGSQLGKANRSYLYASNPIKPNLSEIRGASEQEILKGAGGRQAGTGPQGGTLMLMVALSSSHTGLHEHAAAECSRIHRHMTRNFTVQWMRYQYKSG